MTQCSETGCRKASEQSPRDPSAKSQQKKPGAKVSIHVCFLGKMLGNTKIRSSKNIQVMSIRNKEKLLF